MRPWNAEAASVLSMVVLGCAGPDVEVEAIDRIVAAECSSTAECRVHELRDGLLAEARTCLASAEPGEGVANGAPPWFVVVFAGGKRTPYWLDRSGEPQVPGERVRAACLVPLLEPTFVALADGSLRPDPREVADGDPRGP